MGKIRVFLVRSSVESDRFAVIDLHSAKMSRILEKDTQRREEIVAVKGSLLAQGLGFALKLHESVPATFET